MVAAAVPGIYFFGAIGFLVLWFTTEVVQVFFILRLNQRLFIQTSRIDFSPVYKLFALMSLAVLPSSWFAIHAGQRSLMRAAVSAISFAAVLVCVAYPLFQVNDVRAYLRDRAAARNEKSA